MLLQVSSRAFVAVLWLAVPVVFGQGELEGYYAPKPAITGARQSQDCNNTSTGNGVDFGCNGDSPICVGANKVEPALNQPGSVCKHCLSIGAATGVTPGLVDIGCSADKEVCVDDEASPVLARQGGTQCVRNCNISVEVTSCTIQSGPSAGAPCDAPITEMCRDRKSTLSFRYGGGNCAQSNTAQDSSRFACYDYGEGPPMEEGSTVFIVVQDGRGNSEVLHSDFVTVGSTFNIEAFDDGDNDSPRVPALVTMQIFSSSNTHDPSELLQALHFQIHCSFGLVFIGDTFGASTLVGFSTRGSGVAPPSTGIVLALVDIVVSLPLYFTGEPITVNSVKAGTGFGTLDLSNQLSAAPIGTLSFPLKIPFDFDYTLGPRVTTATVELVAEVEANSELCTGESSFSFKTSVAPVREDIV